MMAKKLLGDAVKEERLRRNLSQNALAEMVNISIDAVFNGENEPMDSTMKQIIAELNQCSNETKRLALGTLRGLLSAVSQNQ